MLTLYTLCTHGKECGMALSDKMLDSLHEIMFDHPISHILGNACINGVGIVTTGGELWMSGENRKFLDSDVDKFQRVNPDGKWLFTDRLQFTFGFSHAYLVKNGVEVLDLGHLGMELDRYAHRLIPVPVSHLNLREGTREIVTMESGASHTVFIVGRPLAVRLFERVLRTMHLSDLTIVFDE